MTPDQVLEITINLPLFKRYRFYQLFDPDGPRMSGYNVRRSLSVASVAVVVAINGYSALSFFVNTGGPAADTVDSLLIMFIYCVNAISVLKIVVFLRNADVVWDLFGFARLDFLTGARSRRHVALLHGYRDRGTKLTDFFLNYASAVFALWCAVPLAFHASSSTAAGGDPGRGRHQNVFNIAYPVTVSAFNRYFWAFYLMEVAMGTFILYNSVLIDLFIVSICFTASGQYEVLATAFAGIGGHRADDDDDHDDGSTSRGDHDDGSTSRGDHDDGYENDCLKAYEDFKSTLYDQILIYKKLKSFYSMIWIIVVSLIFINSVAMIILSYSFIVIFMSTESFTIYRLLKLPTSYFCFAIQIFLYSYLFDSINDKKESVTFGMYSCNWTKMDLKFNKLLLFALRMNNANQLMIKTSPTKIVNLQLFAQVMSTTYNVVSVMLNRALKNK